jgi:co-chaperonin GroES (HSP10)
MKMNLTRDLVLIQADEAQKQTDSGLLLNEDWKSLPLTGVVKDIGPQVVAVKSGDKVLFERYGATILEGQDRLVPEKMIFGIING